MPKLLNTNVDAIDRPSTSLHLELGRFETPWHSHKIRHQLLYPIGGVLHVITESARLLLPARHGALIPAGTWHRLESSSATMMLRTIYFERREDDPLVFGQLQMFPVDNLGQEIIAYTSRWQKRVPESRLEYQVVNTLRLLVEEWCREKLQLRLPSTQHSRLNLIVDDIHDHLELPLFIKEVAAGHGYSVRTFIRLFDRELGMSFGQYKKIARIIRATELLSESGRTVTEVISNVGYESQSSFTRSFKTFLGVTPGEYQKMNMV